MGDERSDVGESSRVQPTCLRKGDRQLFSVELRPGETTFVSWRKLVKDASKGSGSARVTDTPANAHPNLESRIAPAQLAENTEKDASHPKRFNAVIEKIERLYTGKDSSDEEDLMDIPDDDQYDTGDSFIDDAELDEYFEVDNSAIKHGGFFVNRGKLERINEPVVIPHQQPKKRRRKHSTKALGEDGDDLVSNKPAKFSKAAGKSATSPNNSYAPSQNLAVNSGHHEEMKSQNQLNASGHSYKKKADDTKMISDPSTYLSVPNGDPSASHADAKDIEKPKIGVIRTKNPSPELKDVSGSSDASHQKYYEKSAYPLSKIPSGKPLNNNEVELSFRMEENNRIHEPSHTNVVKSKSSIQIMKPSHGHKKDGSSFRSKSSILEKAIRELQKVVAESRPPAIENQEADASSQAMKRTRLSREIKLKLAKVARLAAGQGKISEELINRLMSILGHIVQLRTLKRNLKDMISSGLSAKQEKDHRFQHLKKEVVEMIKLHVPSLESKAFEQQAGASDDFQEVGSGEKRVNKRKFCMDAAMEEKICDLYDLFIDGLDEDSGPQIRKLYSELAELWPDGFMDNHGIKRAICRAKERRRALYTRHKYQETIKKKNMLAQRPDEAAKLDTDSIAQSQVVRDGSATDHVGHVLAHPHKPVSNTTTAAVGTSPSTCAPNLNRPKPEKLKGSSTHSMGDAKMADGALAKKKVKRKPEPRLDGTHPHPEKLHTQSDERDKLHKLASVLPQKSVLPLAAPSGLNSQADHLVGDAMADGALAKKKVQKKSEHGLDGTHTHLEKLHTQSDERDKSIKLASVLPQKSAIPLADHSVGDAKMADGALAKKKAKRKSEPGLDGTLPHPEKLHTQSDERDKSLKPLKPALPLAAPSGLNSQADHSMGDAKMADGALAKKKVKRKSEPRLDGTHPHPEKLHIQSSDERHKSLKLASVLPQKPVLPLATPSGLNSRADHVA